MNLNNKFIAFLKMNPSNIVVDNEKLNNHAYLTKLIFSPNKTGSGKQQFSLLIELMQLMDIGNPFLGGVLTNLCYRYNENKKDFDFIFPELYAIKKEYDNKVDITRPINSRWLVSSTNTIGTIALMRGEEVEAKQLFEICLKKQSLAAHTPLLYMNLCMIYFQYALIKYNEGRVNHATSLFEKCFSVSVAAMNEIYSVRNEYVISMKMDCKKLVDLGVESIVAKEYISNKQLTGSRVPRVKVNKVFKTGIVLGRFQNNESIWHQKVEEAVNLCATEG